MTAKTVTKPLSDSAELQVRLDELRRDVIGLRQQRSDLVAEGSKLRRRRQFLLDALDAERGRAVLDGRDYDDSAVVDEVAKIGQAIGEEPIVVTSATGPARTVRQGRPGSHSIALTLLDVSIKDAERDLGNFRSEHRAHFVEQWTAGPGFAAKAARAQLAKAIDDVRQSQALADAVWRDTWSGGTMPPRDPDDDLVIVQDGAVNRSRGKDRMSILAALAAVEEWATRQLDEPEDSASGYVEYVAGRNEGEK